MRKARAYLHDNRRAVRQQICEGRGPSPVRRVRIRGAKGRCEYVLDGAAFKMTEKQANYFKRREKDEETAAAKQYYILFGLVVVPGEKVELRDVETGGSNTINNNKKDEDISESVLTDIGQDPGKRGSGLEGTVTDRDGIKSEFAIALGDIVFKELT